MKTRAIRLKNSGMLVVVTLFMFLLAALKIAALYTGPAQLTDPRGGIVPFDERLSAVASTLSFDNHDFISIVGLFSLILMPILLQLSANPDCHDADYAKRRNLLLARMPASRLLAAQGARIFVRSLLMSLSFHLTDLLLSLIYYPLQSMGALYKFPSIFIMNPLLSLQRNWGILPISPVVFFLLFALQAALFYALLNVFVYLLSYRFAIDYRLLLLLPFALLLILTFVISFIDLRIWRADFWLWLTPGNLISMIVGGKEFLPLLNPGTAVYLLITVLYFARILRRVERRGISV